MFGLKATMFGETAVMSGGRVTGLCRVGMVPYGFLGTGSEPIAEVSGSQATEENEGPLIQIGPEELSVTISLP